MNLVIDANIVKGFYETSVLGIEDIHLTGSPLFIFQRLTRHDHAFLDDQGHIKHEWRNVVDPEWFDVWFARLLAQDILSLIPVQSFSKLRKQLGTMGFPTKGSKDFWYIKTAKSVVLDFDHAILLSEDLDFHDPSVKGQSSSRRQKILTDGNGHIAKLLQKRESIFVMCVVYYQQYVREE